jgi:hypothetical protein
VLGDSTALVGLRNGHTERLTDDRIAHIALDPRQQYRHRLRAGDGFDATHRALLQRIQQAEREARNRPGGYWIAEADPIAAAHAAIRRYPADFVEWCVLATDGAQRVHDYRGSDWSALPADAHRLHQHLEALHRWEATSDPNGRLLSRAKRHDDKPSWSGAPDAVSRLCSNFPSLFKTAPAAPRPGSARRPGASAAPGRAAWRPVPVAARPADNADPAATPRTATERRLVLS